MTQQEKLNERVEAAVAALPYALNEEQMSRLQMEMDTINDYHRAEMLNAAVEISDAALAEGEHIELWSRDGYCVSFVCWLIGISDFNPFDHPELITIDYALNTFRTKNSINIYMSYTSPGENVLGRLFGKKHYSRNTEIEADATKDGYKFSIYLESRDFIGRIYRLEDMIRRECKPDFKVNDIPLDDALTYDSICNFDMEGVIDSISVEQLAGIRGIRPHTFSDLVELFAAARNCSFRFHEYMTNRKAGIRNSTGIKPVDDILSHTYGVILYSRQSDDLHKILKDLSTDELEKLLPLSVDDYYPSKCGIYTQVLDIYRRAYIKTHFPEIFERVLLADLIA